MPLDITSTDTLNNGVQIPLLGLGVWALSEGKQTRDSIHWAFEAGYRHIDTAKLYANEQSVGEAVRGSGLPREEIFVVTKLHPSDLGRDKARRAFETSLNKLELDVIDLYLIHWLHGRHDAGTWQTLADIYGEGLCRAIGVSNYDIGDLENLRSESDLLPAANQIEIHPYNYHRQKDLIDYCREHGIHLTAYSPLVEGRRLNDPPLVEIAGHYGKSTAQILIRWSLQRGFSVIPRSSKRERIRENAAVYDFTISDEDLERLDNFG